MWWARLLNNIAAIFGTGTVAGDYESIQTHIVGSGGQSSITFSSIPSTYKHLQIRLLAQTNRGTYGIDQMNMRFNSDSGSNYSWHTLVGQGAGTPNANAAVSQTVIQAGEGSIGTTTGGTFGVGVIDILDYANTNKYKTSRMLSGVDLNGTVGGLGGWITFSSGNWRSNSAITNISLGPTVGTLFSQYSHFALYGIKG
jgi:hypothetical protein